jgi:hypothetical protein
VTIYKGSWENLTTLTHWITWTLLFVKSAATRPTADRQNLRTATGSTEETTEKLKGDSYELQLIVSALRDIFVPWTTEEFDSGLNVPPYIPLQLASTSSWCKASLARLQHYSHPAEDCPFPTVTDIVMYNKAHAEENSTILAPYCVTVSPTFHSWKLAVHVLSRMT